MKRFDDIFTPPATSSRLNPRENMLGQIRSLDEVRKRDVRARLFMGQFHDVKNQNSMVITEQESNATGAVGGQPPEPPIPPQIPPVHPPGNEPPARVNIVNIYNSFNLVNVTAPISPRWKTSGSLG